MDVARHELSVTVRADDIDFMGHVNNAVYLNWVQAAVIDHWSARAPRAAIARFLWIAVKHEITYRRPAFAGDRIVTRVTLEQVRRESAFYDCVVQRDETVLAEVRSRWCCIDAQTRRPACLTPDVVAIFLPDRVRDRA